MCHQPSSTVDCLSASRIKLVVEDLPRGFSMALMALCQLLTVAEHGCFGPAEQGRYVQQREAATLCPAAQAFQGRGVLMACAKTTALWNKSLSNLPSGLPTCVSTQLGIGSGSSSDWKYMCVHMPPSWTTHQTSSRSPYSSHLNRLRLQLRRSHQPAPPVSDGCPCPNAPAHEV